MKREFTAEIRRHEGIDGAYVEIPFDVEAAFGARRVKVKAWFDGAEYRGSIVRMGGCYLLGLPQPLRKQIEKNPGDMVRVEVEKDEEERIIELPEDFQTALAQDPAAQEQFNRSSYSSQKDYFDWIMSAKKPETRARRIQNAVHMLAEGKKCK